MKTKNVYFTTRTRCVIHKVIEIPIDHNAKDAIEMFNSGNHPYEAVFVDEKITWSGKAVLDRVEKATQPLYPLTHRI